MITKTRILLIIFCIFILLPMVLKACPPDCGDCEEWDGDSCEPLCTSSYCCGGGCQTCCSNYQCPNCKNCSSGSCVSVSGVASISPSSIYAPPEGHVTLTASPCPGYSFPAGEPTWTAEAGNFLGGVNTGVTVVWVAPASSGYLATIVASSGTQEKGTSIAVVEVSSVSLSPAEIAANGSATSTATATTTLAGYPPITWSIEGDSLGCSINSSTVTAGTTGGTITVRATVTGFASSYKEATLTLVKVDSISKSSYEIAADGTSTSTATATTAPSGRSVTWSIQGDALGCTINSLTGVVTAGTTGGTITIRATDSAVDGSYKNTNLNIVKVVSVSFSPSEIAANYLSTSTATATTAPSGRSVTWSIQGANLGCSINPSTGVVEAGGTGGTITVRAKDNDVENAYKEGTLTLVAVDSVSFSANEIAANGTSTSTATATTTPSGRSVTWSLQGGNLGCSINSSTGVVTSGTTGGIITVRATDSAVTGPYGGAYKEATLKIVGVRIMIGSDNILMYTTGDSGAPASNTPTQNYTALSGTSGGTFSWSCSTEGDGELDIVDTDDDSPISMATVKAKAASSPSTPLDAVLTVTYTLNGISVTASKKVTVRRPATTTSTVGSWYISPNGAYHSRPYFHRIFDQFNDEIEVINIPCDETVSGDSSNEHDDVTDFHQAETTNGGNWTPGRIAMKDILGSPTVDDAPDYEYIQTFKIGGWPTTPDYRIHIKPSEKGVIEYYMWKTIEP